MYLFNVFFALYRSMRIAPCFLCFVWHEVWYLFSVSGKCYAHSLQFAEIHDFLSLCFRAQLILTLNLVTVWTGFRPNYPVVVVTREAGRERVGIFFILLNMFILKKHSNECTDNEKNASFRNLQKMVMIYDEEWSNLLKELS